jgi:hypothetical protein
MNLAPKDGGVSEIEENNLYQVKSGEVLMFAFLLPWCIGLCRLTSCYLFLPGPEEHF